MKMYFEVKPDSELYKEYYKHLEDKKRIVQIYKKFSEKHGIEALKFTPSKKKLLIVSTEKDEKNFEGEFTRKYLEGGRRQFRVNSVIGKKWVRAVKNITIPETSNYSPCSIHCISHSCAFINDEKRLYGSINSSTIFPLCECMTEIEQCVFNKIIEGKMLQRRKVSGF